VTSTLPFGDLAAGSGLTVELPTGDFTTEPEVFAYRRISAGYLPAMGIPLLEGRHLSAHDESDRPNVAVISKSLADRYWPAGSAVGKRFRRNVPGAPPLDITIVGVVGTVQDYGNTPTARLGQTVYVPYVQTPVPKLSVVVQGRGSADSAIAAGLRALRATASGIAAYDLATLERLAWEANATVRLQMVLLTVFAAVAATVAMLGSYGVMSHLVNHRAREMAVRLAIGDSPGGVLRRVLGLNARLAAAGAALGAFVAWQAGSWLQGAVTGIDTDSPSLYLAVLVTTLALTQAASIFPARRAAHTDVQRTLMAG
jgi:ABC-type antimicrobial peptide transport system permease subunit